MTEITPAVVRPKRLHDRTGCSLGVAVFPAVMCVVLSGCAAHGFGSNADRSPAFALPSDSTAAESLEADATSPPSVTPAKDNWAVYIAPYLWLVGIDGDVNLDGEEIDLGDDGGSGGDPFFDPETALSGFMAHVEASKGPWCFAFDSLFAKYEVEDSSAAYLDAELTLRARILEGFVARKFATSWECLAGARYYALDTDVDLLLAGTTPAHLSDRTEFVDPFAGVRFRKIFCEDWEIRVRGDIGGFGVGSDFAWSADALLGYQFTRLFGMQFGYRILSFDFGEGSGAERVDYNLTLAGPILLFSFTF